MYVQVNQVIHTIHTLNYNIMKHFRISPKEYVSEKFIQDYYGYSKKEALKRYKEKFTSFYTRQLKVES